MKRAPNGNRGTITLITAMTGIALLLLASWMALRGARASPQATAHSPEGCTRGSPVSYPAPDLNLHDVSGRPVSLGSLRGQVVLVNMWATWCPPCRREMPVLQATYDQFRQGGFQVVAINIGEPLQQVEAFIRQGGLTFAVWSDPTEESLRAFKTISLPSSFVLDRHGIVRHVWFGEVCADSLQGEIAALLISDEVTSP